MTRLWIVRAGKQGDRELAAIEQGRLLPGFLEVGDLRLFPDRNAILEHLVQVMPDGGRNRLRNFAAQLNQFAHTIQPGDLVMMPQQGYRRRLDRRDYGRLHLQCRRSIQAFPSGKLVPGVRAAQHFQAGPAPFSRRVHDDLRGQAQLSVGSGACGPGDRNRSRVPVGEARPHLRATTRYEDADAEDYAVDIEDIANQQIVSLIKSEFAGHALADLVAEILRVEGYTTKVSPPGPDGGVDILATGGTLGLGEDAFAFRSNPATAPPITTWSYD